MPSVNDELTFEQKVDLSKAIQTLDGQKLERVIQIIHEGVPKTWDVCILFFTCFKILTPVTNVYSPRPQSTEIELEIDHLPANALAKLYNLVIWPLKAAQPN